MGSVGDRYDAVAESVSATLECEVLGPHRLREKRYLAGMARFDFIEALGNQWRRHSSIGDLSPAEYEKRSQANPSSREAA